MKITHLFYHTEAVDKACAINSWNSISSAIEPEDEVIVLDNGNSLDELLPLKNINPKFYRHERIRTDLASERSYTFGLNTIMPLARGEWILLWRSDYIYHEKYIEEISKVRYFSDDVTILLPYECFIGNYYTKGAWCQKRIKSLTSSDECYMIKHSHVCPVYEFQDQPHFAIKKQLWIESGGMNEVFYGYGIQFPELLNRLKDLEDYKPRISTELLAFHQNHDMSFSTGTKNKKQEQEIESSNARAYNYFGSKEKYESYLESTKQSPLHPRREPCCYTIKPNRKKILISEFKMDFLSLLARLKLRF